MTEASTFKCPVCGAPAHAGAFTCHYCGSGIGTLRCARCFQMNMATAQHCSGCGSDLALIAEAELSGRRCCDCHVELEAVAQSEGTVLNCKQCGGQFVEHALLRRLLESRELVGEAFAAAASNRKPLLKPSPERVHYRPCVVCEQLMNRKNFGGSSGVVVDVCARHGTWFDAGELAQVLSFVSSGGLARERAREAQRVREAHAQQRELSGAHSTPLAFDSLAGAGDTDAGSFAKDLLAFLFEVFGRHHPGPDSRPR